MAVGIACPYHLCLLNFNVHISCHKYIVTQNFWNLLYFCNRYPLFWWHQLVILLRSTWVKLQVESIQCIYGNHEKDGMVLDRLRFASHIDNLNGAKSVTIKFNSVEPKVKYSSIKYTCMWHAIYRMQSPCGLASALALCRPTVPMV